MRPVATQEDPKFTRKQYNLEMKNNCVRLNKVIKYGVCDKYSKQMETSLVTNTKRSYSYLVHSQPQNKPNYVQNLMYQGGVPCHTSISTSKFFKVKKI